ncbi:hypothetical protein Hanom_Chr10g00957831 [Helianthus anomalus]
MWALEQKIDQPKDEEAGWLKNMYRDKVIFYRCFELFHILLMLCVLFVCIMFVLICAKHV